MNAGTSRTLPPLSKTRRSRARWGGSVWLVPALFGVAGACNRTDTPREVYLQQIAGNAAAQGGRQAQGGTQSASGGSLDLPGGRDSSGGLGSADGGGEPFAGGADQGGATSPPEAGATSDGGTSSEPEPEPTLDCGTPPVSNAPFTREALRAAAADCAIWHYCRFESDAGVLSRAVQRHVDTSNDATLLATQAAFRGAMASWSRVELFQFGPLASNSIAAGKDATQGQGIREWIYSWPTSARCRVEEQVASRAFASKGMDSVLISSRGLFALDYLLFYPGNDTACGATTAAGTTWPTLSVEELARRKREYALAVASDVELKVRGLATLWRPDGDDFRSVFVSASGYPSDQEAMNVLGFALVYIERELKDYKIGVPLGRTLTHPVTVNESPFALLGTDAIRENLRGFRSLFEGCGTNGEGLGFDDWLREAGHAELATDMLAAYANAQAAADAFPRFDLATPEQLESLYQAIKALTDLLKTDLLGAGSPIGLKLPAGLEGDTD